MAKLNYWHRIIIQYSYNAPLSSVLTWIALNSICITNAMRSGLLSLLNRKTTSKQQQTLLLGCQLTSTQTPLVAANQKT